VLPRIGITTTSGTRTSVSLGIQRPTASLDTAYVEATTIAGGAPLLLPNTDHALATELVGALDGLIVSGGADVDPARYGADRAPETNPADPARDAFELAALDAAFEQSVPVLAICRGMQLLNVACGGTLIQHVPHVTHTEHKDIVNWNVSANPVTVADGTLLHDLVGASHITVNSLHHQAVDRVADGFRCSAVDEDGIIEAIEPVDGSPVLGVQWHPELLIAEPVHEALFIWLVNQAVDRRRLLRA
jgi:putative glutamine amidotransferase